MIAFSAKDEISSTEKLLDLIRGHTLGVGPSEGPVASTPPEVQRPRTSRGKASLFTKRIDVGIGIGYSGLTLVKMLHLSESRCKLLDYQSVAFDPDVPVHSPDFPHFLKSTVVAFCGSLRGVRLWTSVSASQVDVTQIRIPRVAKKELFNAIFWTAKREMSFDEKEVIFDFEVQGEVIEDGVPKTKVMTYTVPKDALKETKDLFSLSGLPLTGITSSSFAVQNLFRSGWVVSSHSKIFANLYISDAYSRIAIFSEGNLVLTREIKSGVDSLIVSIVESFSGNNKEAPSSLDALERKLDILEANWERARAMLFSEEEASQTSPEEAPVSTKNEEILELVGPALERLIRQVERTFEFYSRLGRGEQVDRIFISGAVDICETIVNHISQSLNVKTEIVDPLNPARVFPTDVPPPDSLAERGLYTVTLGLALSNNTRTPNLLFTFEDKERDAAVARINRSIFVVFMSVITILAGYFFWQGRLNNQKQAQISALQQELANYSPLIDQNLITLTASKVKREQQMLKREANDLLGIALLSELSSLTPENIRLVSITAEFGGPSDVPPKDAGSVQKKSVSKNLVVDGIVQGDRQTLEASLALYLLRLGSSRLFSNPSVHSSSLETYQEVGEVLHFIIKIGLVS